MRVSTVVTLVFLAFAMVLVVVGLQYRFEVRTGPLIVGVMAVVLLLAELLRGLLRKEGRKTQGEENRGETDGDGARAGARRYIEAGAWVLGLVTGTYLVGLVIAFPLFILVYLKAHRERWPLAIGVSIAILALIYGVFGMVLHVPLYKGILLG